MNMNDTVARIVEIMFQDVEQNEDTAAIRDEIMNNCQERYSDLVSSGVSEDDAIAAVVESLKGMEDVLAPWKRKAHRPVEADTDGAEASPERHLTFLAVHEIHKIDVCLVNEDISIEASEDDAYHVEWNAESCPLVQAYMEDGVLKVDRRPADRAQTRSDCEAEAAARDFTSDFIRSEDGKIEINMDGLESMLRSIGDKLKHVFTMNGGSIRVSVGSSGVTIRVPEKAVPHVRLLTTSGDVRVQDVALAELNVTSTSGDVDIDLDEDQAMKQIGLMTTSGDVEVSAFAQGLTVTSTSGDVDVEGRYNLLGVSTISGDIDVRADVQNVTFKAVSGDVDLAFESDEIRDVHGSTISGDIGIDLPDGLGFMEIHTRTRSGDVTTRCHTNGVGPTVTGDVSSMSGDITIR